MGKRLLSTLLALALALSLVPAAFAADYRTITLVQETVGDPNEEFVYYILADYYSYMSLEENVELITAGWKRCDCGFMVFSFQPNPADIWHTHSLGCGKSSLFDLNAKVYKVTLKHGEKNIPYTYDETNDIR